MRIVAIVAVVVALVAIGGARLTRPVTAAAAKATGSSSSTVVLSWRSPVRAVTAQVLRDGHPLDIVAAALGRYTDGMLWPNRSYLFTIRLLDGKGLTVQVMEATARTLSGSVARFYAPNSFWNVPIGAAPSIDPNSSMIVQRALVAYSPSANLANSRAWGVPIVVASETSDNHEIACLRLGCKRAISSRAPRYAAPSTGSDHRLVLIDPKTKKETDLWKATYATRSGTWTAGSRYQSLTNGTGAQCPAGRRCQGAVAAGFAALGGVIRPEEIAQGRIDHVLSLATPLVRAATIACPATHTDGSSKDQASIPAGTRIQLDPNFDVGAQKWPRWQKIVARALQEYGAYTTDKSDSLLLRGESTINRNYDAWGLAGVPYAPSLRRLPWDKMRVLTIHSC